MGSRRGLWRFRNGCVRAERGKQYHMLLQAPHSARRVDEIHSVGRRQKIWGSCPFQESTEGPTCSTTKSESILHASNSFRPTNADWEKPWNLAVRFLANYRRRIPVYLDQGKTRRRQESHSQLRNQILHWEEFLQRWGLPGWHKHPEFDPRIPKQTFLEHVAPAR